MLELSSRQTWHNKLCIMSHHNNAWADGICKTQQVKKRDSRKHAGSKDNLLILVRDMAIGFGDITATIENHPTGLGEPKEPGTSLVYNKAIGCCSRIAYCCCCPCLIKTCSRLNDQLVIVMTQLCTALSCLACSECCTELCFDGSN